MKKWYDISKKVNGWFTLIDRCKEKEMLSYVKTNELKKTLCNDTGDKYVDPEGNEYIISYDFYEE